MAIGFGQGPAVQGAIAVAQLGLVIFQRLTNAVDPDRFGRGAELQRIAGPDHDIAATCCLQASDLTAQTDRFGRDEIIEKASAQLKPAAPGTLASATRLPAYCRWLRT